MTDTRLLVGSLSNDLLRVATLTQRGSDTGSRRFLQEAKKWSERLVHAEVKDYIKKIAKDIIAESPDNLSMKQAEKHLMYSVLLQNYSLHMA